MSYLIQLKKIAQEDIDKVYEYIANNLLEPVTAERFIRGIYARIATLEENAAIFAVSPYRDVLAYGTNARHITYKGFAIIYTIHTDIVVVHRIVHGSLIQQ